MTDLSPEVVTLTPAQRIALRAVVESNGGGIQIICTTNGDGYGIPTNRAYRRLQELGLIQGKSGSYSTVVHTREGLSFFRALQQQENDRG